jgi:hypothetical protein
VGREEYNTQQNFYVRKEKETFKEARQDILKENIASTLGTKPRDDVPVYDMPHYLIGLAGINH